MAVTRASEPNFLGRTDRYFRRLDADFIIPFKVPVCCYLIWEFFGYLRSLSPFARFTVYCSIANSASGISTRPLLFYRGMNSCLPFMRVFRTSEPCTPIACKRYFFRVQTLSFILFEIPIFLNELRISIDEFLLLYRFLRFACASRTS